MRLRRGSAMDDEELNCWVMLASVTAMGALALALLYVPGFAPAEEVLACDRAGGYWSSDERICHRSDSPRAGTSS